MKPFAIVLLIALFLQSCGNNGKTKNEATHDAGEQKAIKAEESFHYGGYMDSLHASFT